MVLRQYGQLGDLFFYHHSKSQIPSNGMVIGPETHGQYELLYLIQGNLTYFIEGRKYAVKSGDMILVAPNDIHVLQIAPGAEYERMVLHFSLERIRNAFREFMLPMGDLAWVRSFPVIPGALCQEYRLVSLLLELMQKGEEAHMDLHTVAMTLELLIQLDKLFAHRGQRLPVPISVDPLMQRAVAFINSHLKEPFSLDAMAQALFVSKSTLCHRFRKEMNITVNRYVTVKKIYLADEMIRKGLPATSVYQAVGYNSYTTFFYNFKQVMGFSPSQEK